MDKQSLQKLINSKSEHVTFKAYAGKSAVWKTFKLVSIDNSRVPYVKCTHCSTALKWKSKDGNQQFEQS